MAQLEKSPPLPQGDKQGQRLTQASSFSAGLHLDDAVGLHETSSVAAKRAGATVAGGRGAHLRGAEGPCARAPPPAPGTFPGAASSVPLVTFLRLPPGCPAGVQSRAKACRFFSEHTFFRKAEHFLFVKRRCVCVCVHARLPAEACFDHSSFH